MTTRKSSNGTVPETALDPDEATPGLVPLRTASICESDSEFFFGPFAHIDI